MYWLSGFLTRLEHLPRAAKRIILIGYDVVGICVGAWFALSLWNLDVDWSLWSDLRLVLFPAVVCVLFFSVSGVYRSVTRYLGLRAIGAIVTTVVFSSVVFGLTLELSQNGDMPLQVPISYGMSVLLLIGGGRIVAQRLFQRFSHDHNRRALLIIYGAGVSGRQLATALAHGHEYRAVAFVDDDPSLQGLLIHGLPVHSPNALHRLVERYEVNDVILAMPSLRHSERHRIVERLASLPVQLRTLPGLADLVSGKARVDELRQLDIEDLLGREKITPDRQLLERNIVGKVVLVTGAGGSIGSELCRQIIALGPKQLLLYELSEHALFGINNELQERAAAANLVIVPFLGNVQDRERLLQIMSSYRVQTVYHAAAYKHVPLVEYNVIEGVRNNLLGTWHCAEAAVKTGVERFVLISTDKAVRPTNVMGASKRMAEVVLQGLAERGVDTCFTMVRFGNVLGSSGSVVPLFRDQIRAGGPVTVTHPEINRFFMTISEAAELVIQAGAMARGGDVFVLDMGKPVKIVEVAHRMIQLMGLQVRDNKNPDGDIEIHFTGLRPGEKLYEELLIGNNALGTSHPRIMRAVEQTFLWVEVEKMLSGTEQACRASDYQSAQELMQDFVLGYSPNVDVVDPLWRRSSKRAIPETLADTTLH
jgi:UDP-N-acetylglucosamine 4,6-dehydratase